MFDRLRNALSFLDYAGSRRGLLTSGIALQLMACTAWPGATAGLATGQSDDSPDGDALLITLALAQVAASSAGTDSGNEIGPCGDAGFCYIFQSATNVVSGAFAGVSGGDAHCAGDKPPALPGVGTDYKAILMSTGASNPARDLTTDWVLYANTEYRREDGVTVIATSNASAELPLPMLNSIGSVPGNVYTGIDPSGVNWVPGNNCADWSQTLSSGINGIPNLATALAIDDGAPLTCGTNAFLYCAQQ